jgi:hypothetical protein
VACLFSIDAAIVVSEETTADPSKNCNGHCRPKPETQQNCWEAAEGNFYNMMLNWLKI